MTDEEFEEKHADVLDDLKGDYRREEEIASFLTAAEFAYYQVGKTDALLRRCLADQDGEVMVDFVRKALAKWQQRATDAEK